MKPKYEPMRDPHRLAELAGVVAREAIAWSPAGPFERPPMLRFRIRAMDWLLNRGLWERTFRDGRGVQLYRLTELGKRTQEALAALSKVEAAEARVARG
jgi:hypothetical protein